MTRKPRQSGAAIALVLLVLAIAMTMGMSYLASTSISLAASQGFGDAAEARYLAESGVQHAICLLRENPGMLMSAVGTKLGPYYVDGQTTGYSFAVRPSGVPGYFLISSWAAGGRSTQTAGATVFHSGGTRRPIGHATLVGGYSGFVSQTVKVKGKVHGNGNIIVEGIVDGDVSAVGQIANLGQILGAIEPNAGVVPFPDFDPADYEQYLYGDLQGEAITITDSLIIEHHTIDDGQTVTASNPAGVVIARPTGGSLWLWENLDFRGTLVVHGDLVLDGWNMDLRNTPGFPVLVVTGRIFMTYYADGVNIEGVVYASEGVWDLNGDANTQSRIKGGFVCIGGGYNRGLTGQHDVEYDANRTTLLDPQGWGYGGSVETMSWNR